MGGPCDCSCQHVRPNEALTGRGEGMFYLFNERIRIGFFILVPGCFRFTIFQSQRWRKADCGPLTVNTRSPTVLILRSSTLDPRCSEYMSAV